MEKQENTRLVTLQAGETVILKAEGNATISEVKKPKRNIQKEREWEQSKYHRFTFLVDKEKAEQFIAILEGKRPLDWFREQIENTLNGNETTLNVKPVGISDDELKEKLAFAKWKAIYDLEKMQKTRNDDTFNDNKITLNVGLVATESENDKKIKNSDTLNDDDSTLNLKTVLLKPPPKPDERERWEEEYNTGLPPKRIAEIFGRDVRAVKRHLKAVGLME